MIILVVNAGSSSLKYQLIDMTDEEKESTLSDTGLDLPLESMQDELENLRKLESENEPKQDVDEALDDLMKTKKLELGDLDF